MSKERKQSLFIVAYEGRDTADDVYKVLRDLEKQKLRDIDIKTAMTVHRKDNGKLKLNHKGRVTTWKGLFGGAIIGLILAGPAALLGGAVVGALIGSSRSGDRRDVKEFLEDKLGPDDSALAVLVSSADWEAVDEAVKPYGGTELLVELTPEAEEAVAKLAVDDEAIAQIQEEVDIE
jgi:uncharacterized membrane protein